MHRNLITTDVLFCAAGCHRLSIIHRLNGDDAYECSHLRTLHERELAGWDGSTKVAGTFPPKLTKT